MDKRAEINGRANAHSGVFSSHSLDITFSWKMRIVCTLRTKDGARVSISLETKSIFMFSNVVSMCLEYRFHMYLLIVI